jgi:hypothetical protein
MFRSDNASLAMGNETYCGPHTYYFVFTDDQVEGIDFANVIDLNGKTLRVGPGLE